jgi:geranylgeranyl diphosphate synthase, type I
MENNSFSKEILPAIEHELRLSVSRINDQVAAPFKEMLSYHLGWTGEGAGPEAQGKRVRPLILLLTVAACGADWHAGLPAASAVELVHNFSLVHDDIQDDSHLRRGRETVWKKWGMPMGINVGDALFVIANLALKGLSESFPAEIVLRSTTILNQACLDLTEGQYLDLANEKNPNLSIEDYWQMVSRKTAALISTSTQLGAILGGGDEATQEAYRSFGHYLGLAFQVQDDYLGIWGDSTMTGKSSKSDLISGKNSLPILFSLRKQGVFARRWNEGAIRGDEVPHLSEILSEEGAKLFTVQTVDQLMDMAIKNLQAANPTGKAGEELFDLSRKLVGRSS